MLPEAPKTIIIKYVAPTKFDKAPAKTIWKVMNNGSNEFYIQLNENKEEAPHWERVGKFLEKSFTNLIDNKMFVSECFKLYKIHEDNPSEKIISFLSNKTN